MAYNAHLHTALEHALLCFIWKWKVATTTALAARFYPDRSLESAYKRLRLLERAEYLKSVRYDGDQKFVWMLTKKGFCLVRTRLPALAAEVLRSEAVEHDLTVQAFHLGSLLTQQLEGVELFTEQQLRCLHPNIWPEWVPRLEGRRPDGYWGVSLNESIRAVALEVELHEKSASAYKPIRRAYGYCSEVNSVLWIVPRDSMARRIHAIVNESSYSVPKHDFVLLQDCLATGWNASIQLGPNQGKSILQLLFHQPSIGLLPVEHQRILNTRKSPHKSARYKNHSPAEKSNCKGIFSGFSAVDPISDEVGNTFHS